MNQIQFRERLNMLLNQASKTLCAEDIAFPLVDAAGGIAVLASNLSRTSLDATIEVMRHRLDYAASEARAYYATY